MLDKLLQRHMLTCNTANSDLKCTTPLWGDETVLAVYLKATQLHTGLTSFSFLMSLTQSRKSIPFMCLWWRHTTLFFFKYLKIRNTILLSKWKWPCQIRLKLKPNFSSICKRISSVTQSCLTLWTPCKRMVPHKGLWHWEFALSSKQSPFLPSLLPSLLPFHLSRLQTYFKECLNYWDLSGFYLPPSLGYGW